MIFNNVKYNEIHIFFSVIDVAKYFQGSLYIWKHPSYIAFDVQHGAFLGALMSFLRDLLKIIIIFKNKKKSEK